LPDPEEVLVVEELFTEVRRGSDSVDAALRFEPVENFAAAKKH